MTTRILSLLIAVGLAQAALAQNAALLTTFTNLTPAANVIFGTSVAAVGSDRVLIGAEGSTEAYLFRTNGMLLSTFTNPTPTAFDYFGRSVKILGNDRVLISAQGDNTGAPSAGAVYLFSTNGTLLTTLTNPTPTDFDFFGGSVAAVGNDRVLIGAHNDDIGAVDAGAAYLFSTNGTLLTTFINPTPANYDSFGFSVATLRSDRVLIGAYKDDSALSAAGSAYLFNTNGTLLTTFTNPAPTAFDYFGYSFAAVGNDQVLISAYGDNAGAEFVGTVYLFTTNGTLLTTITNPTPAGFDYFGYSLAVVGDDKILIGAYGDDTGARDAGSAYLFSTNGILLTIITKPIPVAGDRFGRSAAVVGSNHVLIGAADAGAAYLFFLPPIPPALAIIPAAPSNASISWTPNTPGFVLQETESLSPVNWTNSLSGAANPIIAPTTPPAKFFRLRQP